MLQRPSPLLFYSLVSWKQWKKTSKLLHCSTFNHYFMNTDLHISKLGTNLRIPRAIIIQTRHPRPGSRWSRTSKPSLPNLNLKLSVKSFNSGKGVFWGLQIQRKISFWEVSIPVEGVGMFRGGQIQRHSSRREILILSLGCFEVLKSMKRLQWETPSWSPSQKV